MEVAEVASTYSELAAVATAVAATVTATPTCSFRMATKATDTVNLTTTHIRIDTALASMYTEAAIIN
jgi:hypothetical protein